MIRSMVLPRTTLVSWSHERRSPVNVRPSVVMIRTLSEQRLAGYWAGGAGGRATGGRLTVDVGLQRHGKDSFAEDK